MHDFKMSLYDIHVHLYAIWNVDAHIHKNEKLQLWLKKINVLYICNSQTENNYTGLFCTIKKLKGVIKLWLHFLFFYLNNFDLYISRIIGLSKVLYLQQSESLLHILTIKMFSFKQHSIDLIKHVFHCCWSLPIKFLWK